MTSVAREITSLVLVEELEHRVINEYSQAIATLTLAARRVGDAFARRELFAAAERLHAHADAHRALGRPPHRRPLRCGGLCRPRLRGGG